MGISFLVGGIVLFLAIILVFSYIKAPPDMAYIISGLKRRTIIGKAGLRFPFLERKDELTLELIQVDVKTTEPVPNADFINIRVDSVVNIRIGKTEEMLDLAAMHFLNQGSNYIASVAQQVLEGNMREIVGTLHTKEMVLDRQKFADMVKTNAEPDLKRMGLEIISFNVQNFSDDDHAIENLGIDNIANISKDAQISRANAESEVAIAKAAAAKAANDAEVEAQTEIAKKQTDLSIKKSELKKSADIKQAEAEAAKGIEAEAQRKIREITAGDANIARQDKEISLREREVAIKERALEAEVKKTAEAEKFAAQQQADANLYTLQKKAEAEKYQQQQEAEAQLTVATKQAEAQKALAEAERVRGENEAAVIAAKGKAEADAIRMKALAEAEGLQKKADAMAKYGEAAKMDLQLQVAKTFVEQLPAVAKGIAESYTKVGNITMYGDQSGKLAASVIEKTVQLSDGLSKGIGIDLKSLLAGAFGTKLLSGNGTKPDNE